MKTVMCSRLNDFKATSIVVIDYDAGTCSAKSICKVVCGFGVVTKPRESKGDALNREEGGKVETKHRTARSPDNLRGSVTKVKTDG